MSSTSDFAEFEGRLRQFIGDCSNGVSPEVSDREFDALALKLFSLQFKHNAAYRRLCEARNVSISTPRNWREIPAASTASFKEYELSCLPPADRTTVFYSSGTTAHQPSRHFHSARSLVVYELSIMSWFKNTVPGFRVPRRVPMFFLTPNAGDAPRSSLVHMFATLRRELGAQGSSFLATCERDDAWKVDFARAIEALQEACYAERPVMVLGTAFSFVPFLDHLSASKLRLALPAESWILETGGYKGRSRSLPKSELHAFICDRLGVPADRIVSEYGMSELSSQAYQLKNNAAVQPANPAQANSTFHFPPWVRWQIVSPETNGESSAGQAGLLRMFDLANAWSVMAVQTEDLAVGRGDGFELIGRAASAEPRGCSLTAAD
jgi:hypothetical protein